MRVSESVRHHATAATSAALLVAVMTISGGFRQAHHHHASVNQYRRAAYRQSLLSDTDETDWMVRQAFQTFAGNTQKPVQDFLKKSENQTTEEKGRLCRFIGDMTDLMAEISSEHTMEMLRSMPELERSAAFAAMFATDSNATEEEGDANATDAAPANASKVALLDKFGCPTDGAGAEEEDPGLMEDEKDDGEEEESDGDGGRGGVSAKALRASGLAWPGTSRGRGSLFVQPTGGLGGAGHGEAESKPRLKSRARGDAGSVRRQETDSKPTEEETNSRSSRHGLRGVGRARGSVDRGPSEASSEQTSKLSWGKASAVREGRGEGEEEHGDGARSAPRARREGGGAVGTVWSGGQVEKLEKEARAMGLDMEKAAGSEAARRRREERELELHEEEEDQWLHGEARKMGFSLERDPNLSRRTTR